MKVGDRVTRMLANELPMQLVVTDITDRLVVCSGYTFDRETGAETDEVLGWGPGGTGSYLVEITSCDGRP